MSNILQSLNRTVIAGILLAFIFFLLLLSIWPGSSDWFSDRYLAIDQGPIILMIENYRTQLLWNLFMQDPEITEGLNKLGFIF